MTDPRCCGTESCIIDAEGVCWCGQKWDGEKMCFPPRVTDPTPGVEDGEAGPSARQADRDR
jgi:hypothetical protein